MSVTIHPSEQLKFYRPLTRTVKESLYVTNTNSVPIVFKVKTTAPKQYCVRPNAGRVEANSEIEVQIILQPFKEEPPEDYKCKDKFLVQTAPIPKAAALEDITSMWSHIETVEKATMHQHKIKCVFINPEEDFHHADNSVRDLNQAPPLTNNVNSTDAAVAHPSNTAMMSSTEQQPMHTRQQIPATDTTTAPHHESQFPVKAQETEPVAAGIAAAVAAPAASAGANTYIDEHAAHNSNSDLSKSMESAGSMSSAAEISQLPATANSTTTAANNNNITHTSTRDMSENNDRRMFDSTSGFIPLTATTNAAPLAAVGSTSNPFTSAVPSADIITKSEDGPHNTMAVVKDGSNNSADKEKELKKAYSRIAELERQLDELRSTANAGSGLRARGNGQQEHDIGGKKLASTVQPLDAVHQHLADLEKPHPTEGYPPQVVLSVAALVFIFTYLFF
ncbi:hypothetical protein BDF20DRAFT_844459 [Mycotypha africana]|uniref:uncharacterized protein n=1 Tax=Mycotypha africana TaxID=64632 RepID=UPI002301265C|nr:uncharacterized protein BDF20DRAFT_844459 [Mycotypha africana]KAI8991403.1 hypothetical protein BDF20DRAFT_844459 [Mycotypha africana]